MQNVERVSDERLTEIIARCEKSPRFYRDYDGVDCEITHPGDMLPTALDLRDARARIAALEAVAIRLHEGYRGLMIAKTARVGPAYKGKARLGAYSCDCTCHNEEWMPGEPERHKPDCLASLDALRRERKNT